MTRNEERVQSLIDSKICSIAVFSSEVDGRINGTNISFSVFKDGKFEWWNSINGKPYDSFERVLDSLDPMMQTELLFHLDLFSGT